MHNMQDLNSLTGITWALLGGVGGAVKVFVQLLGMEKLPTNLTIFWLLGANVFVSAFSGFMGAILMNRLTPNDDLHIVAAGIAGYMGVAALDLFSNWFKSKVK